MSTTQPTLALSDWLSAATQLSALEMPSAPSFEAQAQGQAQPADLLLHFDQAWEASQQRVADATDASVIERELELRQQAVVMLLQLQPDGHVEALSERLLLPMIAVGWGWAAVAGAEQLDPPMSPAEAESLQLDAALLVVEPASQEMRLMLQLTLNLLEVPGPRQLLLGLLEREIAASLPLPDVRRLLWRFLTDKTPQRAAFQIGELADAKRAANAGPSSASSCSAFQEPAGDFEMDLPIDAGGKAITSLTPWEARQRAGSDRAAAVASLV